MCRFKSDFLFTPWFMVWTQDQSVSQVWDLESLTNNNNQKHLIDISWKNTTINIKIIQQ